MNLVLARACTNSCPYCFESGEREKGKAALVPMENVVKLAVWARQSQLPYLSLLGGEPFLHPELPAIIALFRKTSPGTGLRILTGGIFKNRLLENIGPDDSGIIFNVNEPRDYRNPKHFDKVMNNIETAIRRGFRVILGFNVWRPDFDPKFMPELAHRLGRSNFRWTVANPQRDFPSSVVTPEQYRVTADKCFEMLQEAARLKIEALLDCPLPLCFFTDEQMAWVRQYHDGTASRMGSCEPVIDVTPELEALRCFALSTLQRVKVTDFSSEQELSDWFRLNTDYQLLESGCFPHCVDCPHFKDGRCFGGCLALHKGGITEGADPPGTAMAVAMQELLDAGNPAAALQKYESANFWAKTVVPTFVAAVAATELKRWDLVVRYASSALDQSNDPEIKGLSAKLLTGVPADQFRAAKADGDVPPFVACS
ncbi:radical SAM protein [Dehalogenimonas sp. THU2]|uniref:radical SAM protein n=1 Tax=Dehalogenimonas sp. THU2 TaxID=3151121 RepID=UPI00321814F8